MILAQIGWRVEIIEGGYKAWRGLIVEALYQQAFPAPVILLDGNTGSGKTALLPYLAAAGVQVLDLEGLAHHRGSLFGAVEAQPSQKAFETALAYKIAALDPARAVILEAESSKIGNCRLPAGIWKAMCAAPRLTVDVPRPARAQHLITAYPDMMDDPARLARVIDQLRPAHPSDRIAEWQAMAGAGAFARLAEGLMQHHYDPRYDKHRARAGGSSAPIGGSAAPISFAADNLDAAGLADLAARIAACVNSGEYAQIRS